MRRTILTVSPLTPPLVESFCHVSDLFLFFRHPQNPRRIHRTSAAVWIQNNCPFVTENQQFQVTTAGGSSTPASAPVDGDPKVGEPEVCGSCARSGSISQAETGKGLLSSQMPPVWGFRAQTERVLPWTPLCGRENRTLRSLNWIPPRITRPRGGEGLGLCLSNMQNQLVRSPFPGCSVLFW